MNGSSSRDCFIDLLRIIASFMVVILHIRLPNFSHGKLYYYRLMVHCFVGDANCIFWMITGCYSLSNKNSYFFSLQRIFKRIFLPTQLFSIALFYRNANGDSRKKLWHLFRLPSNSEYHNAILQLLTLQNWAPGGGHLWYVYVYCITSIMKPAVLGVHEAFQRSNLSIYRVFLLLFLCLLFNDIVGNDLWEFSHHSLRGSLAASVFILWGAQIYQSNIPSKKYTIFICIIIMVITVFVRAELYSIFRSIHLLYWYTTFGLIQASVSFLICAKLCKNCSPFCASLLRRIASDTFYIYLIHKEVHLALLKYKVRSFLTNTLDLGLPSVTYLVFIIIYASLVFLTSLLVVEIFTNYKYFWCLISRCIQSSRYTGETVSG